MPVYLTPPPGNPLTRALAAVVAALFLVGAFMVGMVAFLAVLGISLVAGLWFWIRNWRILRQAGAGSSAAPGGAASSRKKDAIDGEFTVISRDEEKPH